MIYVKYFLQKSFGCDTIKVPTIFQLNSIAYFAFIYGDSVFISSIKTLRSVLLSPDGAKYVRDILENCLATIRSYVFFDARLRLRVFFVLGGIICFVQIAVNQYQIIPNSAQTVGVI